MSIHIMPPLFEVIIVPKKYYLVCASDPVASAAFTLREDSGYSCTFKPGVSYKISRIVFSHRSYDEDNLLLYGIFEIYNVGAENKPTGSPLVSKQYTINNYPFAEWVEHTVTFSPVSLIANTPYALVWRHPGPTTPPYINGSYIQAGNQETCPPDSWAAWYWRSADGWYQKVSSQHVYYKTYK